MPTVTNARSNQCLDYLIIILHHFTIWLTAIAITTRKVFPQSVCDTQTVFLYDAIDLFSICLRKVLAVIAMIIVSMGGAMMITVEMTDGEEDQRCANRIALTMTAVVDIGAPAQVLGGVHLNLELTVILIDLVHLMLTGKIIESSHKPSCAQLILASSTAVPVRSCKQPKQP